MTCAVSKQVETRPTNTSAIMRSADFLRGVDDVRAGRPPSFDEQMEDSWGYERGRLFGRVAPIQMPIMIKGRLNPKAVALLDAAFDRGLVL